MYLAINLALDDWIQLNWFQNFTVYLAISKHWDNSVHFRIIPGEKVELLCSRHSEKGELSDPWTYLLPASIRRSLLSSYFLYWWWLVLLGQFGKLWTSLYPQDFELGILSCSMMLAGKLGRMIKIHARKEFWLFFGLLATAFSFLDFIFCGSLWAFLVAVPTCALVLPSSHAALGSRGGSWLDYSYGYGYV